MSLTLLNIHSLRNIQTAQLALHPRFNLITGINGSGKTSILEAVYLLSHGHSFRTRETAPLITHDQQTLTVFARTMTEESISIQKQLRGTTLVQLNHRQCQRSSELAQFLPCQVFYQDIFQIIDAGPSARRSILDWGLFHVKPLYLALWRDYARVLKQRNALLRQKATATAFIPWNKQLVELAMAIDELRREYLIEWRDLFMQTLQQLTSTPCTLDYYRGWDRRQQGITLSAILDEQFTRDLQRQYTHSGTHQADLLLTSADIKAKQVLSRGQQKIILIALKIAQARMLHKECLFLFDDLPAELDSIHLERIFTLLQQLPGQFFITAIDNERVASFLPTHRHEFALNQGNLAGSELIDCFGTHSTLGYKIVSGYA